MNPPVQATVPKDPERDLEIEPFSSHLARLGLRLTRQTTTTLQINLGFLCNQRCLHCHHKAGPDRREVMDSRTMEDVVAYAGRARFKAIDLTGGAPEMNPLLPNLLQRLSPLTPRLMIRPNLTLLNKENGDLLGLLKRYRVVVVASFPSLDRKELETQRGKGAFSKSIAALTRLNDLGFGRKGSGLELNLISNPTEARLPKSQEEEEKRFRQELKKRWNVQFNRLFAFTNVPLGRFQHWLSQWGKEEDYLRMLVKNFTPLTLDGLMCRSLVSVSWDGYLYDCDFNLARKLPMGHQRIHVSEMEAPPAPGTPIAVSDHCYACTAQSGFT